jgi:hypothetical protein
LLHLLQHRVGILLEEEDLVVQDVLDLEEVVARRGLDHLLLQHRLVHAKNTLIDHLHLIS